MIVKRILEGLAKRPDLMMEAGIITMTAFISPFKKKIVIQNGIIINSVLRSNAAERAVNNINFIKDWLLNKNKKKLKICIVSRLENGKGHSNLINSIAS